MKIKLVSIIVLVFMGCFAFYCAYSSQNEIINEYNNYLNLARENAENDIPYVSLEYYRKAFAIKNDDENIFQEYVDVSAQYSEDTYMAAIKEYETAFAGSSYAYEVLAQKNYDDENYKEVLNIQALAKEHNVTSEILDKLYNDSLYKYKIIKNNYQMALPFVGNISLVQKNNKWGYLQSFGKYLIGTEFDEAQMFIADTTPVKQDGEWIVINQKGIKVAIPSEKVQYLSFVSQGLAVVKKDNKYGYADENYNIPQECKWDFATNFNSGVAAVKQGEKWGLIDTTQNLLTELKYDDIKIDEMNACISNGVIFAKENNKYVMLNSEGNQIGDLTFEDADMFKGSNPAAIKIDGKWGFVFADGTLAVEPKYEKAVKSYNLNLSPFYDGYKWGYMDQNGDTIIEPQFDDCTTFTDNGIATVKQNELYSYIQLVVYS